MSFFFSLSLSQMSSNWIPHLSDSKIMLPSWVRVSWVAAWLVDSSIPLSSPTVTDPWCQEDRSRLRPKTMCCWRGRVIVTLYNGARRFQFFFKHHWKKWVILTTFILVVQQCDFCLCCRSGLSYHESVKWLLTLLWADDGGVYLLLTSAFFKFLNRFETRVGTNLISHTPVTLSHIVMHKNWEN